MWKVIAPTILVLVSLGLAARAADEPVAGVEHDFGDSVVAFTLEYEDDLLPPPPWALTGASIRRLGNAFFLTGTEPRLEPGDEPEPAPARRHWIPLVDVVRMAEFADVVTARRALELEATDDGATPAERSVSRGRFPPAGYSRLSRVGGAVKKP